MSMLSSLKQNQLFQLNRAVSHFTIREDFIPLHICESPLGKSNVIIWLNDKLIQVQMQFACIATWPLRIKCCIPRYYTAITNTTYKSWYFDLAPIFVSWWLTLSLRKWLILCFLLCGKSLDVYLSLFNGGRFTAGGGLPLCVLVGLWPDVDDPPSELNGGVRFCGFLLNDS